MRFPTKPLLKHAFMLRQILIICVFIISASNLFASQSVIIESDGYACMGEDKSRKQTEQSAVADAKRKATESAVSYITSETHIKDAMLEKDLLSAYSRAQVKQLQEMMKEWYKDAGIGDCYRVKLKVEVIPDEKALASLSGKGQETLENSPSAPLSVKLWSDKNDYRQGEKIKLYLKGNKPFFAKVVYKDAQGEQVQLLPNPHRKNNYFNGGVVYELPSGEDRFDLEVSPPFGIENVTVYASTSELGELSVTANNSVFAIKNKSEEIASGTRGVKLSSKTSAGKLQTAEFSESALTIKTNP